MPPVIEARPVRNYINGQLVSETTVNVDVTAETVRTQAAAALAGLQAIIDSADLPAGTLTAAQLSVAARQTQDAVKFQARAIRRLIRVALADYSDSV